MKSQRRSLGYNAYGYDSDEEEDDDNNNGNYNRRGGSDGMMDEEETGAQNYNDLAQQW